MMDRKTDQSPAARPFSEAMLLRSAAKGQRPVRYQTALGKNIGATDLLGKNRMKKLRSRRNDREPVEQRGKLLRVCRTAAKTARVHGLARRIN